MDGTEDQVGQTEELPTSPADVDAGDTDAAPGAETGARKPNLAKWLAIYTLLRLGMLVVLVAVLSLVVPLILALLFAVILALPLAWLLFGGVRRQVNEALAISNASRRAERERLRKALNGDDLR